MSAAGRPPWMLFAEQYDALHDNLEPNRDNRGPLIRQLIKWAGCGVEGDPYCAIGVNACLEKTGYRGTRSARAQSFSASANLEFFRQIPPAHGAITVFWRRSKASGLGHVGFYVGEVKSLVYILGFNQDHSINVSPFPKFGQSFGLIGHYWPTTAALPKFGPIRYTWTAINKQATAI